MSSAYFGPPATTFVPGGAHVAVYLLPVYSGQLAVFDVEAREARGRWLPWDILPWRGNPYELASELADLWCQVPLTDLSLADIMSFPSPEDAWEIAIVFRAELAEPARGDDVRTPYFFPHGQFDAIGPFDPIDLERWVTGTVVIRPEAPPPIAGERAASLGEIELSDDQGVIGATAEDTETASENPEKPGTLLF